MEVNQPSLPRSVSVQNHPMSGEANGEPFARREAGMAQAVHKEATGPCTGQRHRELLVTQAYHGQGSSSYV